MQAPKQARGRESLQTGIASCLAGMLGKNSGLLQEQQVLLTAEPSFQSQNAIKKKSYTDSLAKDHLVALSCVLLIHLESCTGHGGFLKLEAEYKTPSEGL